MISWLQSIATVLCRDGTIIKSGQVSHTLRCISGQHSGNVRCRHRCLAATSHILRRMKSFCSSSCVHFCNFRLVNSGLSMRILYSKPTQERFRIGLLRYGIGPWTSQQNTSRDSRSYDRGRLLSHIVYTCCIRWVSGLHAGRTASQGAFKIDSRSDLLVASNVFDKLTLLMKRNIGSISQILCF